MLKKQIHRRLESLFLDLSGEQNDSVDVDALGETPPTSAGAFLESLLIEPAYHTGWTWQIDEDYRYTCCGPEINDALQIDPQKLIGQEIFAVGLHPASRNELEFAFQSDSFPCELEVLFNLPNSDSIPVRLHILSRIESEGEQAGWRGFAQWIPQDNGVAPQAIERAVAVSTPHAPALPVSQRQAAVSPAPLSTSPYGYAVDSQSFHPVTQVWTETGKNSLQNVEMSVSDASEAGPAAIAYPLQMKGVGDLLLEIVDDDHDRAWSEDDRLLVMEVASQLALALDNAQLYQSVQQELSERIRAEQAILRRNRDLSTLNRIGQQLSRLATRQEIFDLLAEMIGEVLDTDELYICAYTAGQERLSFPVYRTGGKYIQAPDQAFGSGIPEAVIRSRAPLLVSTGVAEALGQRQITLPERIPASLLAIPMVTGERALGAIIVQDYEKENAFDSLHVELLSTAASQATTALENANLFQQMQTALEAIENRERYQANVARAAAVLTESGTKAMGDVLKALSQAARCSRIYFGQVREDDRGAYWTAAAEWVDPAVAYLFDRTRILHVPVAQYSGWERGLREKGWIVSQSSEDDTPEAAFLNQQHIRSCLILAVPGGGRIPSFLAFDQLGQSRAWQNDEINALRVAADAVSNTFIREGLLDQLQVTLDETEGLYKASNRLALANDMQEMVASVLSGVRAQDINRAVLLLFEYESYGKISQISVGANWYSGRGAPPPPVGAEYPRAKFEYFLQTQTPVFLDDVRRAPLEKELQEILLQQNVGALAILPLWSGKRQIGVLALESEKEHPFSGRETRTYPQLVDQMATAVENQRLFDQTQVALSETELLYNVSNRVAQTISAADMLTLVVETILPKGADQAGLILINSDANGELVELEIAGFQDIKGNRRAAGVNLSIDALPLVKMLTDELLLIPDSNQFPLDPASKKTLQQLGIAAACMVPLRTGGRLIGLLSASSRKPAEFSQEETRVLRIVGNGIAVALEKQRLLRQAQRRALELQTASEIARDTASTLSLDLLLNRIVNMLSERFDFYHTAIFLLDDLRSSAIVREATGQAGQELKQRGQRVPVGSRTVVGTVSAGGEPYILNDVLNNPDYSVNALLPETRSEMGIPLKLGTDVIGVLDLHSKTLNAFNQDDVTVLQILTDQIAIAIENARAYELSQRAIEDMKEVDRVKSQFLANMSHELRTPLNSIIGFSRVIIKGIDGPINEIQKQDLSAIYNSGQHLLSLITDILDLSKIEAGKLELSFTDVNVSDMINSAMSTAVGLVKDKPIRLQTIVPDDLPVLQADSTRVRQVLINFLSNAAKFTDEGTIVVEATKNTGEDGRPEIMITVTDTGPGIAQQDQSKLFLPFSQVDDSPTRKTGGTGLGLSICRSLIEMHNGRIGLLHSEVGKGSTFFFTLPLKATPQAQNDGAEVPEGSLVLAIDDDPKVISLYERYLKPQGYQVIALTDPKQAVEQAKKLKPFAITLDIMMPEKDGWQVLHELKNESSTRNIPIIICSILESQEKGFSVGASDYLVKPFLQEEMINALDRLNRDGNIRELLIIDDDPDDLRLVQKMFETSPAYHLSLAQGGVQGWSMIQEIHPDAIILDLFMPEMNGFAVLENLRSNPELSRIPVIVLTGADLSAEHHQQLTNFGQSVLTKGFLHENELLISIEEALRKFHPAPKQAN